MASANFLALVNGCGVVIRLLVGFLQARAGTKRLLGVALAGQVLTFAILPAVAVNHDRVGAFVFLLCISKCCYGSGFTLINLFSGEIFGARNGTQVYSLLITAFAVSAIFSPSVLQAVSLANYCYMSAGLAAAGLVALLAVRPFEAGHEDRQEAAAPLLLADTIAGGEKA